MSEKSAMRGAGLRQQMQRQRGYAQTLGATINDNDESGLRTVIVGIHAPSAETTDILNE